MGAGKTYDYIVTLKPRSGNRAYDWISHLLLFLSVIGSAYFTIFVYYQDTAGTRFLETPAESRLDTFAGTAFAVLVLSAWIYDVLKKKPFRLGLFIAAISWFYFSKFIIGILYIIAGLLEKQVKFPVEIAFDSEGVTVNSFPRRSYTWPEVKNVVMKDDILTLDLKSNKIIQQEVMDEVSPGLEKEFNEFCLERLRTAAATPAV